MQSALRVHGPTPVCSTFCIQPTTDQKYSQTVVADVCFVISPTVVGRVCTEHVQMSFPCEQRRVTTVYTAFTLH